MTNEQRLTETVCGCCGQTIDVTAWFVELAEHPERAFKVTHCLYPNGKVQWCYVNGIELVCGQTTEEFKTLEERTQMLVNWMEKKR